MENPSKIDEGGIIYTLAKMEGGKLFYDFPKIITYLDIKGKKLFGSDFKIYPEDHDILLKLSNYFIRDEERCAKYGIDIGKGILLSGPVGCGKTSLMRLLRHIVQHQRPYEVIPSRNIAFAFNHLGYKVVEDYGNKGFFCFDDLGVEPIGRYYGKDCNVLGEILISRHDLFIKHKIKTHSTTNLNAVELEERYGNRVRSRMRQMFNLVAFDKHTKDKRA